LNLTELQIGKQAMLADFSVSRLHQRLLAMGFTPGSVIRVLRRLPMNGNLYVEIGGRYLALRFAEAKQIAVNVS
jgi:Fe2+ transport system protein FeoA